ncbi:MAG: lamin tail domain-containing protein [Bradymonadaceae bacterium]|nr:lamin tail domain-containing protein [Lujinxingiaceae bacterium]
MSRVVEGSPRAIWTALVLVLALGVVACGEDERQSRTPNNQANNTNNSNNSNNSEPQCVVGDDDGCDDGLVCSSDALCVAPNACEDHGDCDSPPVGATCQGPDVVTLVGRCAAEAGVKRCTYPEQRVECELACVGGACVEANCAGVVCNAPPSTSCAADDTTLNSYEPLGSCFEDTGACVYTLVAQACAHGCEAGACVAGVCTDVVCDSVPANRCDANTAVVYAEAGTCRDSDGAATCSYPFSFDNCSYRQATCNNGACEGGITQKGGVVIVEYMAHPNGFFGGAGEWFEIVNTSGSPINLAGWKIRSGGVSVQQSDEEHMLVNPPSFPAGARLLLSNSSNPGQDGTVEPYYQYPRSEVTFNNGSDWLALVNAADEIVDYVFYEAGSIIEGRSRKLNPDVAATVESNDDFGNWCPSMTETYGTNNANYGSPASDNPACSASPCLGAVCTKPAAFCNRDGNAVQYAKNTATCEVSRFNNPFCDFGATVVECNASTEYCLSGACEALPTNLPLPGEVVFSEFMGNPSVNDALGEWIELYNRTDRALSLFSLSITDNEVANSFDSYTIVDRNAVIAAKGYIVFVRNTDAALNGGISGGFFYSGSHLKNAPGEEMRIRLVDRNGTLINEAHYGAPSNGVSQQLSVDFYEGDAIYNPAASLDAASWCAGEGVYGDGGSGTPGASNLICPL